MGESQLSRDTLVQKRREFSFKRIKNYGRNLEFNLKLGIKKGETEWGSFFKLPAGKNVSMGAMAFSSLAHFIFSRKGKILWFISNIYH